MPTTPRYKVATVTGFATNRKGGFGQPPGLSAHVLDTMHCHRVVATFRSEQRIAKSHTLGKEGALAAATALAAEWNGAEGE